MSIRHPSHHPSLAQRCTWAGCSCSSSAQGNCSVEILGNRRQRNSLVGETRLSLDLFMERQMVLNTLIIRRQGFQSKGSLEGSSYGWTHPPHDPTRLCMGMPSMDHEPQRTAHLCSPIW